LKTTIAALEAQLNDFDTTVRAAALAQLIALADEGLIPLQPPSEVANMHCHTFFSFNAYGYSPTALAWLAKRRGFKLMGSVEFDVLDSVDEFLDACRMAGVRASTGLETRVFVPELGIYYHMGIGFTTSEPPEPAATILSSMRERVRQRNLGVMQRVNSYLDPLSIDYEQDVLPLTPSGNATERHMVVAYLKAAQRLVPDPARFWADKLHLAEDQVSALMEDGASFQGLIRRQLMKRGGVGYVRPGPESFPSLDRFHEMVKACGALICATWLDGTSEGEQSIEELLDLLIGKGAVALNIVPDRNWNVADPELRRIKLRNLYDIVEMAQELSLPLNVGTEMNSFGQKLIDDFGARELAPVRQQFLDGAYFACGHTVMQRQLGLGYHSEWARAHLPSRTERNEFYRRIGYQVEPGRQGLAQLERLDPTMSPEQMLESKCS